jgi:hypothetical protein
MTVMIGLMSEENQPMKPHISSFKLLKTSWNVNQGEASLHLIQLQLGIIVMVKFCVQDLQLQSICPSGPSGRGI